MAPPQHCCNLQSLPDELLDLLLSYCEHPSQKHLRLVNHRISNITTPYVFEHVYIGLFAESLYKLGSIARSRLAYHVKKFTLYIDALPHWSQSEWEEHM